MKGCVMKGCVMKGCVMKGCVMKGCVMKRCVCCVFFKWSFSVYGNQNPETTLREKL